MSVTPISAASGRRRGGPTSTTNFGSGRREAHDASAFYDRFVPPEISVDNTINRASSLDVIHHGDARRMTGVPDNSVALVVTSPPYFAGKQYEEELGVDGVPADYFEYLQLLSDVFAECKRVLEPGGRIAVNVANLGRRPYRSLSGDVTEILQDLGLLLRGEVIWWKGRAAGGSCAWGSFQSPANPVLRDVTERIVIASKGRFDRALTPRQRAQRDLPSTVTISREEFMAATTDMWEIPPESATRVGHPAPFPVGLPQRLIDLYTYKGDTVLDPFMGSGSSALAALRTGRHYIGFDTDADYIRIAEDRVRAEGDRLADIEATAGDGRRVELSAAATTEGAGTGSRSDPGSGPAVRVGAVLREGRPVKDVAEALLAECGFHNIRSGVKPRATGIELSFVASDSSGADWAFDVSGSFSSTDTGLRRSDTLWKSLATAGVFHESGLRSDARPMPLILVTTHAPTKGTAGHKALKTMLGTNRPVFDVIELLNPDDRTRLCRIATGGAGVSE